MATMLVCRELATLNRKRPHGQARLQKAMELEECLRSVVPLALETKLAFISRAPYGPMFSLLKKLHIKRGLNECFIHQHKSEIPHTECASIDVRTLNRVKDKIFFPLKDALIVCLALGTDGRLLRGKGEAVGGSSGQMKEALC